MSNSTTTVKIPASITHDHAYAYGWLTSSIKSMERAAKIINPNDPVHVAFLIDYILMQSVEARELDAELSRRADERIRNPVTN
jgi:hypothetical protein